MVLSIAFFMPHILKSLISGMSSWATPTAAAETAQLLWSQVDLLLSRDKMTR
jgi:hypothetical protein